MTSIWNNWYNSGSETFFAFFAKCANICANSNVHKINPAAYIGGAAGLGLSPAAPYVTKCAKNCMKCANFYLKCAKNHMECAISNREIAIPQFAIGGVSYA